MCYIAIQKLVWIFHPSLLLSCSYSIALSNPVLQPPPHHVWKSSSDGGHFVLIWWFVYPWPDFWTTLGLVGENCPLKLCLAFKDARKWRKHICSEGLLEAKRTKVNILEYLISNYITALSCIDFQPNTSSSKAAWVWKIFHQKWKGSLIVRPCFPHRGYL